MARIKREGSLQPGQEPVDEGKVFTSTAPSVARCHNDPQRRALRFKKEYDARMYYADLLHNGSDALLCQVAGSTETCVCEVRPLGADEALDWMNESV